MENKYKVIIDPPKLSDKQIAKHQDFDALLAQVQPSVAGAAPAADTEAPRQRRRWLYYLSGATAAALIGLFFYQTKVVAPVKADQGYFAERPFIDPPFKQIKASYTEKSFNANRGGVFEYANGSKIIVPAAAFVDNKGNIVEGEVDIRYREFHDYIDFFLSGIPMQYDSAGTLYQLESAGMVEIYAEQGGQKVNVAPGKEIDVELVSEMRIPSSERATMPKYNVYQLDTEARNWVYRDNDNIEVIDEEEEEVNSDIEVAKSNHQEALADFRQQELVEVQKVEASIPLPQAPVRPKRQTSEYVFDFNINDIAPTISNDPNRTPEENAVAALEEQRLQQLRKQYKGTLWQCDPNDYLKYTQNAANNNLTWEDVKYRQLNNGDYEFTLISGDFRSTLIANPVLSPEDYKLAIKEFNQQFDIYQQELTAREAQLAEAKAKLRKFYKAERDKAERVYQEELAELKARGLDREASEKMITRKIINRFQATAFGIWNCDRPLPPSIAQVKGEFKDDDNHQYDSHVAFLVNQNRNTVARFRARPGAPVSFETNSDNLMWLVTPDNKIALFRPEKFRKINQKKGDHTFVLNVIDKKIQNEEDVRKILEF